MYLYYTIGYYWDEVSHRGAVWPFPSMLAKQIYEVSKNILLKFSDTMIYMATFDMDWCSQYDPIVIERNVTRFQLCSWFLCVIIAPPWIFYQR